MTPIIKERIITQAEADAALEREIRTGFKLKQKLEEQRIMEARKQAGKLRGGRTVKGLGKAITSMPEWEFFRLIQKYGTEEVHSKEFQRYLHKRNPDLKISNV